MNSGVSKSKSHIIRAMPLTLISIAEFCGTTLVAYIVFSIFNAIRSNAYYSFIFTPLGVVISIFMIIILNLIPYNSKKLES